DRCGPGVARPTALDRQGRPELERRGPRQPAGDPARPGRCPGTGKGMMTGQPMGTLAADAAAELAGQVAFVTGGATGIGLGRARGLAARGAVVAIFNRNAERAQAAVASITAAGGRAEAFEADVSRTDSVEKGLEQALVKLGRVDILVNNAGVTRDGLILR